MPLNYTFKPKPKFDYQKARVCKSCRQNFNGRFCGVCGEKVIENEDNSVLYFLGQLFSSIAWADNKVFRSVLVLISNPGQLSFDVFNGRRVPYMKPISLFFLANLLYFLLPTFETFNTTLYNQMNGLSYSKALNIKQLVEGKVELLGYDFEEFVNIYNVRSTTNSKLLLILMAPVFSLVLTIVCYGPSRFYAEHLLFSMEFLCFTLLINAISLSLVLKGIVWFTGLSLITENLLILLVSILSLYFLIRGMRKFYEFSWLRSVISAILCFAGFYFSLEFYRLVLFLVTLHTID